MFLRREGESRQLGFTLLEILVALAILGLAVGVMMGALHTAAYGSRMAAERGAALSIAQSLLAAQGLGPGAFGARSGVTAQGYRWEVVVKPWAAGGAAVGVYWVRVEVARDGAPVRLTTLETGPAYAAR